MYEWAGWDGAAGVPEAPRGGASNLARHEGLSVRAGRLTIFSGIVALGIGFTLGLEAEPSTLSAFDMIHPTSLDFPSPLGPQIPKSPRVRLASLETEAVSESDIEDKELQSDLADFGWGSASFNRFSFDPHLLSFDERFVGAARFDERFAAAITPDSRSTADVEEPDGVVLCRPIRASMQERGKQPVSPRRILLPLHHSAPQPRRNGLPLWKRLTSRVPHPILIPIPQSMILARIRSTCPTDGGWKRIPALAATWTMFGM